MNTAQTPPIILASTSPFRKELLGRLNLPFATVAPDVDESRLDNEPATDLVGRLSEAKARAVGATHEGLIIGSDQVATHGETILGKPGDHATAMQQLRQLSGEHVTFLTGLCLLNSVTGEVQLDVVHSIPGFEAASALRGQTAPGDEPRLPWTARESGPRLTSTGHLSRGVGQEVWILLQRSDRE